MKVPPDRLFAGRSLRWPVFAWFLLVGASLAGCSQKPNAKPDSDPASIAGVNLRLVVVGDPAMASAIAQLKGEWTAQTGASFEVVQAAALDPDHLPDADAAIVASHQVGVLGSKDWLAPIPPRWTADDEIGRSRSSEKTDASGWRDLFPLLQTCESKWGGRDVAAPFGSPVLICYYRADLLEKLGARPPRTWGEYTKLAERLADRKNLGGAAPPAGKPWHGALEPLGPGWAGLDLLARAAPYAAHRSNYSVFFNIDTMEPLVDGPPFVRALAELIQATKGDAAEQLQLVRLDPAGVRRAFWQGQCGLAVTWPSASEKIAPIEGQAIRAGFVELPGSKDVYDIGDKRWTERDATESTRTPLLGVAGRFGVIHAESPAPEAAARLLFWLSGSQWNRQVCPVSPATTLFRASDERKPAAWVEKPISPQTASAYAAATKNALSRPQAVLAMRIPGRSEYLAALDEAVQQAVAGRKTPEKALADAAAHWREITKKLGEQAQKDAYRHSLGL
jgi:multiple sugar transport system substrate-binding protein